MEEQRRDLHCDARRGGEAVDPIDQNLSGMAGVRKRGA